MLSYIIVLWLTYCLKVNKLVQTYKCVLPFCVHKALTEEDYIKLGRFITYLSETIHLLLIIGADSSGVMTWNMDASFAAHPDFKSQTGGSIDIGTWKCHVIVL